LEECRIRTEELRREIVGLRKEKENYLGRFRSLAQAQIQFIDTHESDFEDLDKRLLDIVDNVTVSVKTDRADAVAKMPVTPFKAPEAKATFAEVASPTVAPAPTQAPISSETDVWRDYDPSSDAEAESETTIDASADHDVPQGAENSTSDNEGKIADLVSETFTETDLNETADAEDFITGDVVKVTAEDEPAHDPLTV